jgi:hypothetical protein
MAKITRFSDLAIGESEMKRRVMCSFLFLVNLGLALGIGIKVCSSLQAQKNVGVFGVHPINGDPFPKFMALAHGCGGPNDHWSTAFVSRDGMKVSMTGETFSTNGQARKELYKKLRGAVGILEQQKTRNDKKRLTEERVVALFHGNNEKTVSILWTENNSLFQIQSISLETALELERPKAQ